MARGQFRIYLGAAAGVGTTHAMLDEGLRRRARGATVMVDTSCAGGRPRTETVLTALLEAGAEPLPIGADVTATVLAHHPQVVLIDDLVAHDETAHTVGQLLEAGIDVVATLTIGHIAELAATVRSIVGSDRGTGSEPTVTIDERLLAEAQIEVVDISAEAIRRRIAHGNVFGSNVDPAAAELFNSDAFTRLRAVLFSWLAARLRHTLPTIDRPRDPASAAEPTPSRSPDAIRRRGTIAEPQLVLGLALLGLVAMTAAFVAYRDRLDSSTMLSLYLLAVVTSSAIGGWVPGLTAAIVAPLLATWFLIEPYHTFRVNTTHKVLELVVFVSVAGVVSAFVSVAARRSIEAEQARHEAVTLAALAGGAGVDALRVVAQQLCTAFSLDGVAVFPTSGGAPTAVAGTTPPTAIADGDIVERIDDTTFLVARGRPLTADQRQVLTVFLGHLASALERQRTVHLAEEAAALAKADELRTAILRAVSHDLRSPLASIKASVSSLRQHDVDWPDETRQEFLASVEDETDRLTAIIANLLDMSRLEAGVLAPVARDVSLEEVVPAALHSLGIRAATVELSLPDGIPDVRIDPALLERVLANVVGNAIEFSPRQVRITAAQRNGKVQLYVVDHGPGIHPRHRDVVLQPFHRLDDTATNSGVGLGLAIADRLTAAMGGSLELRDTPGGGLTVSITLPAADAAPDNTAQHEVVQHAVAQGDVPGAKM